jgi:SAM-dependent methyltransferase
VVSAARSTIYDVVCRGDALSLPFPDQVFDVIISFETLEHLAKPDVFVGELRRVLRTNGKLLLSTPNALVSLPKAGVPQNPFHVHEFEPEELRQLLSVSFARVSLMGQHVDERYPSCPYWDFPGQREPSLSGWIHGLWWKALNILPTRWGSVLYERVHGRSLYPKEEDFCFSEEAVERAHVLVATCG